MTLSRSPIKRKPSADAVLAAHRSGVDQFPGRLPRVRKGLPRRTEHPFPLPTGSPVTAADVREADPVEGPQWELCHTTECAACFLARWVKAHSVTGVVDWSQLCSLPDGAPESHGHHEPTRGAGGTDKDTLPLCAHHHHVRHVVGVVAFWLYINWQAIVIEMRRRVALTKPVPATASETNP